MAASSSSCPRFLRAQRPAELVHARGAATAEPWLRSHPRKAPRRSSESPARSPPVMTSSTKSPLSRTSVSNRTRSWAISRAAMVAECSSTSISMAEGSAASVTAHR